MSARPTWLSQRQGRGSTIWKSILILVGLLIADTALSDRRLVSQHRLKELILKDLRSLPVERRKHARYLSLAHYHNQVFAGRPAYSDADMRTFRFGVSKAVNSVSWSEDIVPPQRVTGSQGTLLRIFMDDYSREIDGFDKPVGLDEDDFDVWGILDPYGLDFEGRTGEAIERLCGTSRPLMRADYFIVSALGPDSYPRMMGMDLTTNQLEKRFLGKTIRKRIKGQRSIVRAGFSNSGVAFNNRLIERHPISAYGKEELALWGTYDFDFNRVTSSIFTNVVGPVKIPGGYRQNLFSHVAGEYILELPNHLHAFWLKQEGNPDPIDAAPIELVRDPHRGAVQSPISCFDCHRSGIIRRDDHVRPIVEANRSRFSPNETEFVRYAFPDPETDELSRVFDKDKSRYDAALKKLRIPRDTGKMSPFEPITRMWDLHREGAITKEIAAAELGLTPRALVERVSRHGRQLSVDFKNFELARGTMNRESFEDEFRRALIELKAESRANPCPALLVRRAS